MSNNKVKIMLFKLEKSPEVLEINNELKTLQKLVNGYIQVVPLYQDIALICNECGMLDNLPYQKEYGIYGDFFIIKTDGEDIVSMDNDSIEFVEKNIKKLMLNVL